MVLVGYQLKCPKCGGTEQFKLEGREAMAEMDPIEKVWRECLDKKAKAKAMLEELIHTPEQWEEAIKDLKALNRKLCEILNELS